MKNLQGATQKIREQLNNVTLSNDFFNERGVFGGEEIFAFAAKSFDLKTKSAFGSAEKIASEFCIEKSGEPLIFTSDIGYFSAAKAMRSTLFEKGFNALLFCADDGEINPKAMLGFFNSSKNPACVIVVGGEDLYLATVSVCPLSVPVAFVPLDCEFCRIFGENVREPELLVIDSALIEKLSGKHKEYSACCAVEAGRLSLFDIAVYSRFLAKEDEREKIAAARSLYLKAIELLNDYYKTRKIASLALASAVTGACERFRSVADAAGSFAELLKRSGRTESNLLGESKLYSAEAIFLIYELFLSEKFYNEYFHALYPPDLFYRTERLKNDFSLDYAQIKDNLPDFAFDYAKIDELFSKLVKSDEVKLELANLKNGLLDCRLKLKGVYGGKKRSVRDYSIKNRASALFLAPLEVGGFCVLKLAYAAGMFENIEV